MAAALTADQETATKAFVDAISDCGGSAISRATAIKFLLARKFDVSRATALWRQHEATRRREGLLFFDPLNDPLKTELATGKFTVLATRDATGAAIAIFTANKHQPTDSTHQTTLQGVVYQLDVALQSIDTQRAGLVFIYDMTDSKYTNFDYDLSQKILTLLKGGYPAKLKKVLIVTAPLWFKAPFRILRLFVREKLRERVHTVSAPQLSLHVPRRALPARFGGAADADHKAWLLHCLKSFTNGSNGVVASADPQIINLDYAFSNHYAPPPAKLVAYNGNIGEARGAAMTPGGAEAEAAEAVNGAPPPRPHDDCEPRLSPNEASEGSRRSSERCGSASSGFSEEEAGEEGGLAPARLLARVALLGRRGLQREYDALRAKPPQGTFLAARIKQNLAKNRYTDVLCFDHSRVLLSRNSDDVHSDYINANYVDGYKQKNAFISTQGPLAKTYGDFWQMVWEQRTLVIVMTTKVMERGRVKCGQYWPVPDKPGEKTTPVQYGNFRISSDGVTDHDHYAITDITITNMETDESRRVSHWQYLRWPDYGVPSGQDDSSAGEGDAAPVLAFLRGVREAQHEALQRLGDTWAGHCRGPPIVVHCSAGIGRTGSFCTLDICTSSLEERGTADVRGTVEKIRSQRAFSIQMPEQYVFCHLALLQFAAARHMLPHPDLSAFRDGHDSD